MLPGLARYAQEVTTMLQFRNRFGGWKLLSNAVQTVLEQAPELGPPRGRLEELIQEAETIVNQQEEMRSRLRQATHRRQEVEREGEELRQRMTAALQSRFGFRSDVLLTYGIAPRQQRERRSKAEVELERVKIFLAQIGVRLPDNLAAMDGLPIAPPSLPAPPSSQQ
jgi:chromosome segregation ATPase